MKTIDKVKQLVAEQLCISVDEIADDADIMALGADSIDVVEMLTAFEEEFDISIPDSVVPQMRTIKAIVKAIEDSKK